VRSADKLATVERLHGLPHVEHVVGDITDRAAVDEALAGCDACLHVAAVTTFRGADADAIASSNALGGTTVLDAAVAAGCDPIVHVSTVSAVFPPSGPMLSPDDPVTEPQGAYSRSKAEIDRHARALQDDGIPVTIIYPGGVLGPTDAGVSIVADGMSRMLNFGLLAFPQGGGTSWVDVRDFAEALSRLVEPGRGPRRYMAGGRFLSWTDFISMLQEVTGGDFDVQRPPNDQLRAMAEENERQAALTGEDPPIDVETAEYMCEAVGTDDSRLLDEFGIEWRPTVETWTDLLRWCLDQGLLDAERAPRLARPRGHN
jgi:nucleoside-diphosphate-sugar epimerase